MNKKILIIQTASLGDVILITPMLEALHDRYPEHLQDVLVKKGNESLFDQHTFLNRVWVWDKNHHKYLNLWSVMRKIRHERYEHVITVQRFWSSGMLTALSGASHKSGFSSNPWSWLFNHKTPHRIDSEGIHEIDRNLSLLSYLEIDKSYPVKLYPGSHEFERIKRMVSTPYITIAPGSLWATKQFPAEGWVWLLNRVPRHVNCYLIGGSFDEPLCQSIYEGTTHPGVEVLAGKTTLLESAALIKGALMNYTNDSSPLHLASAVNAPVTAVFCSTIPAFGFGPLSDDSAVVEIREPLKCRPCGIHGKNACPEKHFLCGKGIDEMELINRLKV